MSKDSHSSAIAVELSHTSPLFETHFSLHFLQCVYIQLSVPLKREGDKSFLFSAKVWACLAVVKAKRPVLVGTGKVSAQFFESLSYSVAQSSYTSTRNIESIKYIKTLKLLFLH